MCTSWGNKLTQKSFLPIPVVNYWYYYVFGDWDSTFAPSDFQLRILTLV
jgi:hypothetical protein